MGFDKFSPSKAGVIRLASWSSKIDPNDIEASGSFAEALGNLIKSYERVQTQRVAEAGQPVIARLDGRSFTKLTKGFKRPFDDAFIGAINQTMIDLVEEFNAVVGFCQSDEISLVFMDQNLTGDGEQRPLPFNGKWQKLCSVLAGRASAKLALILAQSAPTIAERIPTFDCRVFNVPDLDAAALSIYWRHLDARKNSVLMHAAAHFSHHQIDGKTQLHLREMCKAVNAPWEALPEPLKNGRYCRRMKFLKTLTAEELARIPPDRRPDGPVMRSKVDMFELGPLSAITNLPEVLFYGAAPTQFADTSNEE